MPEIHKQANLCRKPLGSYNRLPFHLQAKGEFEYVGAKPLGDGFVGVPVKEFRGALLLPFFDNRMAIAGNFLIASGYTGQTLETIPFQPNPCPVECIVGVPLKSYVSLSWSYYFRKGLEGCVQCLLDPCFGRSRPVNLSVRRTGAAACYMARIFM